MSSISKPLIESNAVKINESRPTGRYTYPKCSLCDHECKVFLELGKIDYINCVQCKGDDFICDKVCCNECIEKSKTVDFFSDAWLTQLLARGICLFKGDFLCFGHFFEDYAYQKYLNTNIDHDYLYLDEDQITKVRLIKYIQYKYKVTPK